MVTTTYSSDDIGNQAPGRSPVLATLSGIVRHPLQTCRILYFVNRHPCLSELPGIRTGVMDKAYRPYLSPQLDCAGRIALLERHYDIVQKAGFGKLVQQAATRRLILCTFTGKSGARYRLELSTTGDHHRAGEWVLRLVTQGIAVYTATFLFAGSDDDRHLIVGSLTGMLKLGRHSALRVSIMQATWDFHGWQPRQMMLSLVQEIGASLGCRKAVLIGNRNRLPVTMQPFCRRTADHDRTWRQLNATERTDGNFELPCPPVVADIRTGHARGASTRRVALMDFLHQALRMRLAEERAWPATVIPLPRFDGFERKSA